MVSKQRQEGNLLAGCVGRARYLHMLLAPILSLHLIYFVPLDICTCKVFLNEEMQQDREEFKIG